MDRQIYDMEKKRLSFLGRRATDTNVNTHIYLPKAAPLKRETAIQMVKERLYDVAREFGSTVGEEWTLTREESQGIRSLQKRCKEGELSIVETD